MIFLVIIYPNTGAIMFDEKIRKDITKTEMGATTSVHCSRFSGALLPKRIKPD